MTKKYFKNPSKTQQNMKDSTNIRKLVETAQKTHGMSSGHPGGQTPRQPMYGDFSEVGSFKEMNDKVAAARSAFMEVPSAVRRHFNNDPGQFYDFMSNPDNLEKARSLGIVVTDGIEPKPDEPQKAQETKTESTEGGTKEG
jgi:hypothetical protein